MSSNEMTAMTTSSGEALAENKVPIWRLRKAVANYIALIPYLAFALFPFYIIFITSLKSKQEINNSAVGRYKRDLSEEQIDIFNSIAGEMLHSLGYE